MDLAVRIELTSSIYRTETLPLSYARMEHRFGVEPNYLVYKTSASPSILALPMERVAGNDPASSVWKTEALPLDDTRLKLTI